MRKIVFLASSLSYGGAEKMLCFVANGFFEAGNHVTVINLLEHPDNAGILNSSIPIVEINDIKIRYISRIHQLERVYRVIKRIRPDVIISFKFLPNYIASLIGKVLRIPVIISERSDPWKELGNHWRVKLYCKLINSAEGGVFQTKGAMEYYSLEMQEKGIVIPNPVFLNENITHIIKKNEDSNKIISIGRLSNKQKRYDILLQAFKQFARYNQKYKLEIFGDGEDESTIHMWTKEFGLESKVFFGGKTKRPLDAMNNADIFLITSDYEGISNALLEAMAIGMPVVTTDSSPGGARMLIEDGENGLIVPCGDIIGIARSLDKMANDYNLRCRCGENAKKVNEIYRPEKILEKWMKYTYKTIENYNSV